MSSSSMMPIAIVVGGLGIGYWWYSSQDKTPVGLVATKTSSEQYLGTDEDGNKYRYQLVEVTYREDDSSLPVASESADRPMMVIYKEDIPIDVQVIDLSKFPTCGECDEVEMKLFTENMLAFAKEYKLDTEDAYQVEVDNMNTVQEAESIFGPMMSLQSNFVW